MRKWSKSHRILLIGAALLAISPFGTRALYAWPHVHVHIVIHPPPIPTPAKIAATVATTVAKTAEHAATETKTVGQDLTHATGVAAEHTAAAVAAPITTSAKVVSHDATELEKVTAPIVEHDPAVVAKEIGQAGKDAKDAAEKAGAVAATVGGAAGKGLDDAAIAGKKAAAHLVLDAAHAALTVAGSRVAAEANEVRVSAEYGDRMLQDVREGKFGHATQDLSKAVSSGLAAVSPDSVAQAALVSSNATEALRGNIDAIQDMRAGKFGQAAEAMGRSLTATGALVSAAGSPEVGLAMTQAGNAIETQAPYAEVMVADLAHGNPMGAVHEAVEDYVDPEKSALNLGKAALDNAKAGRFGEAALQATTAVSLVSGVNSSPETAATDSALLSAQSALTAVKEGRYGAAGENAGDALTSAGQALMSTDPETGQQLASIGTSIHEDAATVQQAAAELHE